jgi:hypothetical protein
MSCTRRDVPGCIEHIMLECPRWECRRRQFGTLAPELIAFVREFATSPENISALLLGCVPPSLHGTIHFSGNGRFSQLWRQALPHIAFFVVHVSQSRNVLLREMGLDHPSRITRMGRRPDGLGGHFWVIAGTTFILICMYWKVFSW